MPLAYSFHLAGHVIVTVQLFMPVGIVLFCFHAMLFHVVFQTII